MSRDKKAEKGTPVKIRDGPAAVTGDMDRNIPLTRPGWEGAAARMIRKVRRPA